MCYWPSHPRDIGVTEGWGPVGSLVCTTQCPEEQRSSQDNNSTNKEQY